MQGCGMEVGPVEAPEIIRLPTVEDDSNRLEQVFQNAVLASKKMLFFILPSYNSQIYNEIKRPGDIKYGVATACMISTKLLKGQPQYLANETMKVNLKLNGGHHHVEPTRLPLVPEGKTMIVRIDVTHPTLESVFKTPSIYRGHGGKP
ncbi:hypothetical protein BX600DRAFT_47047 [Xylariales sp. PMI_506]|nr:hypothetical protein BX600DRAFT_47047 [Xylariales sp. PMI_506]